MSPDFKAEIRVAPQFNNSNKKRNKTKRLATADPGKQQVRHGQVLTYDCIVKLKNLLPEQTINNSIVNLNK